MLVLFNEFTLNFKGPDTNLDCLKIIGIGGSPVKKENFEYLRNNVKKDVFIGSMYGKFFVKILNEEIKIRVLSLQLKGEKKTTLQQLNLIFFHYFVVFKTA